MGATERTRHVRLTHDVFLCMPHPSDIIPVTSQCHHFLVNVFFSFPFLYGNGLLPVEATFYMPV